MTDSDEQTANEVLLTLAILHQIRLAKYRNGLSQKIIGILNRADPAMYAALLVAIEQAGPSASVARIKAALAGVLAANSLTYQQIAAALQLELAAFLEYEVEHQKSMLEAVVPDGVPISGPSIFVQLSDALAKSIQGMLLADLLVQLQTTRASKIQAAVIQGVVESKSATQIVTEIRGTAALSYSDGLMSSPRNSLDAVTRTAVSTIAAYARNAIIRANSEIIQAVQWCSILDGKTTSLCRERDGKLYDALTHAPIKHGLPWLSGPGCAHWNCRSEELIVLKSAHALGVKDSRMTGMPPKMPAYSAWVASQSAAIQDEILGPSRGKLYRNGKLQDSQLYPQRGQTLTLDQMQRQDTATLKRL